MEIKVTGGDLSQAEIDYYVNQLKSEHRDKIIRKIEFSVDGEYIDVTYDYETVPFERIRRITGYLVGSLDRFNNAKRSEVEDRISHNL